MRSLGFQPHNHSDCIKNAVSSVEAYCADRKLRLTPVRKRVLEILLSEHRALGAYEILDQLRQDGLGGQPPVVYRALDFLVTHRFAHKIERLNAFIACAHPGKDHSPAFLICNDCGSVAESQTEPEHSQLCQIAKAAGFVISDTVSEADGTCPKCLINLQKEA